MLLLVKIPLCFYLEYNQIPFTTNLEPKPHLQVILNCDR